MEARKYLKKSCCYHHIECPAANFLTAFMWRRPLNSAILTTITHRKSERVSDGTSTQVVAQMINKCRIKIVQKELYNVRDPPRIGDRKNHRRKYFSNLDCICNCFQLIHTRTYLLGPGREWIYLDQSFLFLFDYFSNRFYLLFNSLGPNFLTHSLQIYCTELTGPISLYILGLGFKTFPYNWRRLWGELV